MEMSGKFVRASAGLISVLALFVPLLAQQAPEPATSEEV
jgi:hypothetical protein